MTIFFDIDDTLYDRSQPFIAAANEFFGNTSLDLKAAYKACMSRGDEVFIPSQRGEITMDEMYIYRYGKGFADVGINISKEEALSFQQLYREKQNCITLSSSIEEVLKLCNENRIPIGAITNGPSNKQWNKVNCLGLLRFMPRDMIIISGDIGIDKPDPAIFRHAEQISGESPSNLLYVGDSLKSDIYPAASCGWHTIWFNRSAIPVPEDITTDAVAYSESELLSKIKPALIKKYTF